MSSFPWSRLCLVSLFVGLSVRMIAKTVMESVLWECFKSGMRCSRTRNNQFDFWGNPDLEICFHFLLLTLQEYLAFPCCHGMLILLEEMALVTLPLVWALAEFCTLWMLPCFWCFGCSNLYIIGFVDVLHTLALTILPLSQFLVHRSVELGSKWWTIKTVSVISK